MTPDRARSPIRGLSAACADEAQLGRCNLEVTSIYLQGTDNAEIIVTVHS